MGIAVVAESTGGGPVAIVDTDPQASLKRWFERRQDEGLTLANIDLAKVPQQLAKLARSGIALCVIDTPGFLGDHTEAVIAACDLVLVPVQASILDLELVADTIAIAERHHRPVAFVLTGATPRATVNSTAIRWLSQHGTVAPVTIHRRGDVPAAAMLGQTASETDPKGRSAQEISELWDYVRSRLDRQARAA